MDGIAMAQEGGIGVSHVRMIEQQAAKVRNAESGMTFVAANAKW
jgi:IMP dehydrogenase/GMP reductase